MQFTPFSAGSGLPNLREPRPDPNSNPNGVADPNFNPDGVADVNVLNLLYPDADIDTNSLANPDGYRNTAVLCRPIRDNADRRQYRARHDRHRKSLG